MEWVALFYEMKGLPPATRFAAGGAVLMRHENLDGLHFTAPEQSAREWSLAGTISDLAQALAEQPLSPAQRRMLLEQIRRLSHRLEEETRRKPC